MGTALVSELGTPLGREKFHIRIRTWNGIALGIELGMELGSKLVT
jgi:hypothetical protein